MQDREHCAIRSCLSAVALLMDAHARCCERRELHGAPLLKCQVARERFNKHLGVDTLICGGCSDRRAATLVGTLNRQHLGVNMGLNPRRSHGRFKNGIAAHCRSNCEQIAWSGQGQTVILATRSNFHSIADVDIGASPVQSQVHLGEAFFTQPAMMLRLADWKSAGRRTARKKTGETYSHLEKLPAALQRHRATEGPFAHRSLHGDVSSYVHDCAHMCSGCVPTEGTSNFRGFTRPNLAISTSKDMSSVYCRLVILYFTLRYVYCYCYCYFTLLCFALLCFALLFVLLLYFTLRYFVLRYFTLLYCTLRYFTLLYFTLLYFTLL